MSRALVGAVILTGMMVGMPVTAYAAGKQYTIDADRLGNQRLPADPAADFPAPAVTGGRVTSDVEGTACTATYARVTTRQESAFGYGFVRADW